MLWIRTRFGRFRSWIEVKPTVIRVLIAVGAFLLFLFAQLLGMISNGANRGAAMMVLASIVLATIAIYTLAVTLWSFVSDFRGGSQSTTDSL